MAGLCGNRRAPLVGFGILALLVSLAPVASAATGDMTLVTRATGATGAVANANSAGADLSDDGRFVAFASDAGNIGASSAGTDVFVRDTQTATTTLISRATGVTGALSTGDSFAPSISGDGRFVAFVSSANNLGADGNFLFDVFIRDTQTATTTLVSRGTGVTGTIGDDFSLDPSISADGRFVAFESGADNLDLESTDDITDVFVRDTQDATTTLVSRATGVTGTVGAADSGRPSISASGRFVSFDSISDDLDLESNDAVSDVFVRDIQDATTTLVSRASTPSVAVGDGPSLDGSISADGRFVAFESQADNLEPDGNASTDVFIRDTQAATTALVSRAGGPADPVGDNFSLDTSISADGRLVAFRSLATNLDPDSNDAFEDVFVRDTQAATTTLVSRAGGAGGPVADAVSNEPAMSPDGHFVAYSSQADNLDLDSNDSVTDIFRRELPFAASNTPPATGNPPPAKTAPKKKCKKKKKGKKKSAAAAAKKCKKGKK
jgi:Tol biopolymer transport system component